MFNFQRDGSHRQDIGQGRVAYEPNTLDNGDEFRVDGRTFEPVGLTGFTSHADVMESPKLRARRASFEDHFSQARLFWVSQSPHEQAHLVAAFQFELSKLSGPAIRQRMVDLLAWVDADLATQVAAPLGVGPPDKATAAAWPGFRDWPAADEAPVPSAALSMRQTRPMGIATRSVAILVSEGVHAASVLAMQQALSAERAYHTLVAPTLAEITQSDGSLLQPHATLGNTSSLMFDGIYLPAVATGPDDLGRHPLAQQFVAEAYRHGKTLAASGTGTQLLGQGTGLVRPASGWSASTTAGVTAGEADVLSAEFTAAFVAGLAQHRHWDRSDCV
jgi:catalase